MVFSDVIAEAFGGAGVSMEYETELFDTSKIIEIDIAMDEDDWAEKGLLYQFSWRAAGKILAQPGEERGGWGPVVKRPWGGLQLGHEDYPYGAPDFPEPHFDLEGGMYLPWILDEPLDGPTEE